MDQAISEARAAGRAVQSLDRCGIDRNNAIQVINAAVGEPFQVLAEVHGTITTKSIACLFDLEAKDGTLSLGEFTVSDASSDGLRIANFRGEGDEGAPKVIRDNFAVLAKQYPTAAVASLGPGPAPIHVSFVQDETVSRLEIGLPYQAQAEAAQKWLVSALASAAADDNVVSAIHVRLDAAKLVIESPPFDAIPPAIRARVIEAFRMPSGSMFPTLEIGDHFFVAKGPLAGTAERGDLVVFQAPQNRTPYIKRVVGVGGDKVAMKSGSLWLNGKRVPGKKLRDDYPVRDFDLMSGEWRTDKGTLWSESVDGHSYQILRTGTFGPGDGEWDVPPDHLFVIGDNRDNSVDSRSFGPVPKSSVVGHVSVLWISMGPDGVRWDRIGKQIP